MSDDTLEIKGKVGDIYRFHAPSWNRDAGDAHYLIMELSEDTYCDRQMYVVLHLESGRVLPDLLLDESNVFNYAIKQVG